jgi:rRNA-processing protein FCF1
VNIVINASIVAAYVLDDEQWDNSYLELAMRLRILLATLDEQLRKAAIAEGVPLV